MRAPRELLENRGETVAPESGIAITTDPPPHAEPAEPPPPHLASFVSASQDVLFFDEVAETPCDVCGETVKDADEGDDEGHAIAGRGLYLWTRGDEVRWEEPPLCPACASALGLTALARWEIDEEEG